MVPRDETQQHIPDARRPVELAGSSDEDIVGGCVVAEDHYACVAAAATAGKQREEAGPWEDLDHWAAELAH